MSVYLGTKCIIMNGYISDSFLTELQAIGLQTSELIDLMVQWGDQRSKSTIAKSIQRMCNGTTSVSPEIRIILNMLHYMRHTNLRYRDLLWSKNIDGSHSAEVDQFILRLFPQTKGRWHVTVKHQDGYSHPYPRWQNSLEEAKDKSIEVLQDAIRVVVDAKREKFVTADIFD